MNKPIKLTEQDLHFLVENAVQAYLTENEIGEGVWGGIKNAWNGVRQGNLNVAQSYKSGNIATNFGKYANQAVQAIEGMKQIANQTGNQQICTYLDQAINVISRTSQQYSQISKNVSNGNVTFNQAKNMGGNIFKMNKKQMGKIGYYDANPMNSKVVMK